MNKKTIITALLALVAMAGQAQEARIDTIVPKFLINGYCYKKMATEWMINKSSWARYYGNYFEVNEEKYGGVSMFIPQWSYQTTDNKYIQQMGWYYAAGYQDIGW